MVWYQKRWVIVLSCILFFPLGFFLVRRKYPEMGKVKKILLDIVLGFWLLVFLAAIFGKPQEPESIQIDSSQTSLDVNAGTEIAFSVSPEAALLSRGDLSFSVSPAELVTVEDLSNYSKRDYRFAIQSLNAEGNAKITIRYQNLSSNDLEVEVVNAARVEAVNALEEKIAALAPITIDKENDVKEVRRLYDAMDPTWQKTVPNAAKIDIAEQEIEKQYVELVEPINIAIADIGEATLDSEPAIVNARALYNEAPDSVKTRIPAEAVSQLIESEKQLTVLKLEAAAAPTVEAITNISLDSQESITRARTAYDALSDAERPYVTNYDQLVSNEAEYTRLAEERAQQEEASRIQQAQTQEETIDFGDTEENDSEYVEQNDAGYTVYWVANGKVYHTTPNCTTLKRSSNIHSGSIAESGKSRACKVCG